MGVFLSGFQSQGNARRIKEPGDLRNAGQQARIDQVGAVGMNEPGVEGDELKAQGRSHGQDALDVGPGFRPGLVGHHAAGGPDHCQRGIILADATEHARNHGDARRLELPGDVRPVGRIAHQGVEGQLHPRQTDGPQRFDELRRPAGLERPTAHRQNVPRADCS